MRLKFSEVNIEIIRQMENGAILLVVMGSRCRPRGKMMDSRISRYIIGTLEKLAVELKLNSKNRFVKIEKMPIWKKLPERAAGSPKPEVTITPGFVLFWSGWPSQWYRAPFTIDGVTYNCAEQYMMAEKAKLFGDDRIRNKILATRDPREQKALGRKVQGFNVKTWESRCRGIVYKGNLAKFEQNPDLRQLLLDTGDRRMVEASPVDRIWGIGLAADNRFATDPAEWRGTNWLGEALDRVRLTIRAKDEGTAEEVPLQGQLPDRAPEVTITPRFVLFWAGWPSHWYPSSFVIESITYNCAEQYMMAEKARLFGDDEILALILASPYPPEQNALGRKVRGFDVVAWEARCREIVFQGNLAKFEQNAELRQLLLDTGDRRMVEASSEDQIWGVGLDADDSSAIDPAQWRGTNWLGDALDRVRLTIRATDASVINNK